MEIGEPDPGVGQAVEVGRLDLPAECAEVGEAEVVCNDHQEVGALHGQASCQVRRQGGMPRLARVGAGA